MASGLPSLADDSGLAVTALDGAPGIYSARWAGEKKISPLAMARVERELNEKDAKDFSAKFVCALALADPDGKTPDLRRRSERARSSFRRAEARASATIRSLWPMAWTRPSAKSIRALKHAMSHRANALSRNWSRSLAMSDFGIYVHWPFCAAKCPYCDFNSHVRSEIDEDGLDERDRRANWNGWRALQGAERPIVANAFSSAAARRR